MLKNLRPEKKQMIRVKRKRTDPEIAFFFKVFIFI